MVPGTLNTDDIWITQELLSHLSEIDEFKGAWRSLGTIAPERLNALRRIATIESIGSSTRIEGSKLSDREVERLLGSLEIKRFSTRDEQEVAGYAEVMETVFRAWSDIPITENYIKQLHRDLLQYSDKDKRHRGEYKNLRNDVGAFGPDGKMIGIVFETATPFDTPQQMPTRGAWIETDSCLSVSCAGTSLPTRGAWIETMPSGALFVVEASLPTRGAWIETRCVKCKR